MPKTNESMRCFHFRINRIRCLAVHSPRGHKNRATVFATPRPTVERDGLIIMVDDDRFPVNVGEKVTRPSV